VYRGKSVSVVIPCYNEEEGIRVVLEGMPAYVDEVIVVDNNCTDRTAAVAQALGAHVVTERRRGYGYAYHGGFPHARGDIIATVDGDGTYPTTEIARLIEYLDMNGVDFVSASRFPLDRPDAMHRRNQIGNHILTSVVRLLYRITIADSQSGMWVFRRRCLEVIHPAEGGMAFSEEIKLEAIAAPGIQFAETHIPYAPRIGTTKLFTFRDGVGNLVYLFRRRLRSRPAPAARIATAHAEPAEQTDAPLP
jgi:glycosyltransferase involved in cell wall biosynthesis